MKTRSEILRQVKEDLEHIPRGPKGSMQNHFRQMYSQVRKQHIAKTSKTREETLVELWNDLKKGKPDFVPIYDQTYFKRSHEK